MTLTLLSAAHRHAVADGDDPRRVHEYIDTAETTTTTASDRLTVTVGSTTLATFSNLNRASGHQQRAFNVGSFADETVTVKFSGSEDSSLQTSFVVDDAALTAG